MKIQKIFGSSWVRSTNARSTYDVQGRINCFIILLSVNDNINQSNWNVEKLGEFLIYSGNFCKCDFGHQVLCIIVSNSSIDWLDGKVTGMGAASHRAP